MARFIKERVLKEIVEYSQDFTYDANGSFDEGGFSQFMMMKSEICIKELNYGNEFQGR